MDGITEKQINPVWAGYPEEIGSSRLILVGLGNLQFLQVKQKNIQPGKLTYVGNWY
jgi:hypothetical protein